MSQLMNGGRRKIKVTHGRQYDLSVSEKPLTNGLIGFYLQKWLSLCLGEIPNASIESARVAIKLERGHDEEPGDIHIDIESVALVYERDETDEELRARQQWAERTITEQQARLNAKERQEWERLKAKYGS